MKTFLSIILFIFIFSSCGSNYREIKSAGNIDDAKSAIDNVFNDFEKRYKSLCGEKRNDQLKEKYSELSNDIRTAIEIGWENENLNYEEQNKVVNYAINRAKKSMELNSLAFSSKIECW